MDSSNVRTGRLTWLGEFDRYQWTVFLIAWIGWALDATDFGLFAIVLRPALTDLLGDSRRSPNLARLAVISAWSGCWAGHSAGSCSASLPTISAGCGRSRSASWSSV